MNVTVTDVRHAVSATLAAIDPAVPVYGEEVEATRPYFLAKLHRVWQTRMTGRRYVRSYKFDVQYFPSTAEPYGESHAVADKLYEALELIPIGSGKMRGARMRHVIIEGILHFFFTIEVEMFKQIAPSPLMASADMEETIL
ncbi:phage tail terminator family protein [Cohnella zeiphila]|uniref:Uncharacterized protein n=1 Tax=Cohnella zeiphila TaxID=2761120 RepID=A0A7X0SNK7_9BACL|nr:hypothetical protein [Cohnella zeiphila]MBB6733189.1 hypothetical protein [Cohnella zeiphila]